MRMTRLVAAAILAAGVPAAMQVLAQAGGDAARGSMLYDTHCVACHSTRIHWREQKLATDWNSLRAQVRRWQGNAGLNWSDAEVEDVVRYLNVTIYRFPSLAPLQTG